MRPFVSVVMPAYNAEGSVAHAIESALAQTYRNFEVIVCDDASADRTAEVVRSFADERIRLLKNAANLGEGSSRDKAIEAARGRWVALLDADDAWLPERLETMVPVAKAYPNHLIFDEIIECHDAPRGMIPWRAVRGPRAFDGGQGSREIRFPDFIRAKRTVVQPLIPTEPIRKFNVMHSAKKFSADLEYFLELIARGVGLCYVPKAMYLYRVAAGSMSSSPTRHRLLRETLEESLAKFSDDAESVEAIRYKIRQVRRNEEYQPFFSAIMSGNFLRAALVAWEKPWVVPEFCGRSMKCIPYHFHRLSHRGSRRKTA